MSCGGVPALSDVSWRICKGCRPSASSWWGTRYTADWLGSAQSNGGDTGYAIAFVVFGLTAAVALAIWTALAVRMARLGELPGSVLRVEKLLAVGLRARRLIHAVGEDEAGVEPVSGRPVPRRRLR